MKTIFDKNIRDKLINRVNSLNENSKAQWGKMNVYQMVKHCILCEEMYLGKTPYKRTFLGFLLGKLALQQLMKDDKPKKRNSPTKDEFKIIESNGNLLEDKMKWISLIGEYENYSNQTFVHWFFGKMTKEQVGISVYKHIDHHLRQFDC
ncbi:MAG: DUF1569 domain-containing protein [Cytophagales bacterium]|nr:MAG: DUF1569 domain-containing protein [Cytophagales bacterium]